ncbi:MAG TPA: phosphate ABC transporter permease PstA [Acidimicrobiales bacterium]|nr:phosphate ABC transporter permease PstA [Acidimicrobiales bacterium]
MSVLSLDPILSRRAEVQRIAEGSLRRRQRRSRIALALCVACILVALVPLVAVVAYTVERGAQSWSVDFFAHLPTPAGISGGGIWNSIVGSLIIDAIAAAAAVPLGFLIGLFLAQADGRIAGGIRFAADVLSGVPSITVGIFAYGVLVTTLHHFSAIAGSFGIGLIMLPVIIRSSETAIRTVPVDLSEAALSLGAKNATIARRVVLPAALPGLVTGMLLAVARGAGESAPLLFTAIGSQYLTLSPFQPMAAMPLTIYLDGIQAFSDLQRVAWGTGLLLVVIVLLLSITSRLVTSRLGRTRR